MALSNMVACSLLRHRAVAYMQLKQSALLLC